MPADMRQTPPILLSIPEQFETDRLLIRAPREGDGAAVNAAVIESLKELQPWMPWAQTAPTAEEAEVTIRRSRLQYLDRSDLRLLLFRKDTGELAGSSGLHRIDWAARRFEIGYWLRTSCQGQGFMTEAADGITRFAINELAANRIEIRCDARNTKSAQVAQRLGFTLEGILRSYKLDQTDKPCDAMIFAKVRGIEF